LLAWILTYCYTKKSGASSKQKKKDKNADEEGKVPSVDGSKGVWEDYGCTCDRSEVTRNKRVTVPKVDGSEFLKKLTFKDERLKFKKSFAPLEVKLLDAVLSSGAEEKVVKQSETP
jgi:hypothetical protein